MFFKRLLIKDFCAHTETEFCFDDFASAIVIGKIRGNDLFSNGSGKSTIFNAIEYVIFNETKFSYLEKIIRDGCDTCFVELEFISSIDNALYKIIRSNNRKTGTDLRLYKHNGSDWTDLTQRRVTDSEKEIQKLVGFNYKTFCASCIFSQAGSENNIQRDYSNLAYLTPEKRKSVLKEVLQLNIYNNYEKLAKQKGNQIQVELQEIAIQLHLLGDPDKDKLALDNELGICSTNLVELNSQINSLNILLTDKSTSLAELKNKKQILDNDYTSLLKKQNELLATITKLKANIFGFKQKNDSMPQQAALISNQIKDKTKQLQALALNSTFNLDALEKEKEDSSTLLVTKEIEVSNLQNKIKELELPVSSSGICSHCRQNVTPTHYNNLINDNKNEIIKHNILVAEILGEIKILKDKRQELDKNIVSYKNIQKSSLALETDIKILNADIINKREMFLNNKKIIDEQSLILNESEIEYANISTTIETNRVKSDIEIFNNSIKLIENEISIFNNKLYFLNEEKSKLLEQKAIINHKIEQCAISTLKINELTCKNTDLNKSLMIYQKVIQAFGSNGIPALITHTILDELQLEINQWLLKLRPGLQLQFIVNKEDKEQSDTLDILYFIDSAEREYKQLSGAQKIIIALSLKLGLIYIMRKRLGLHINLILLDEVDQALDEGGTDIFAEIIKIIEKELKILVITHNPKLKYKFSHAIVVEQDEYNTSKGKLIGW